MQHELDWLGRYLDKKGIDLIVLYQLSMKEIIKYLRLSPFKENVLMESIVVVCQILHIKNCC